MGIAVEGAVADGAGNGVSVGAGVAVAVGSRVFVGLGGNGRVGVGVAVGDEAAAGTMTLVGGGPFAVDPAK